MTTAMNRSQIDDETTMFIVISDTDVVAGPFFTRETAYEYAEAADGSVFRLVDDDEGSVS